MYDDLISLVIDKTDDKFVDFPYIIDGEVYIGGDAGIGWETKQYITPLTQIEQEQLFRTNCVKKIDTLIQDEVNLFNVANNVAFESIHNCKSFSLTDGYFLQAECKAISDWAFLTVWETMRVWEHGLSTIPTEQEFKAKLDSIVKFSKI